LKLTRGTDYGLQGILYLATQPFEQVTLLHDIAKNQGIPETYLAKIFQDLTKADWCVPTAVRKVDSAWRGLPSRSPYGR